MQALSELMPASIQPDWVSSPRTALCIIDVQYDFAAAGGLMGQYGCDLSSVEPMIEKIKKLEIAARANNIPVIFVGLFTSPKTDSPVWTERMRRANGDPEAESAVCRIGTPGADFYALQPTDGDLIIKKPRYSSFYMTDFEEQLRAKGIDTLIACGLTTECCVDSTVRDGFHRDFNFILPADACAAYEADIHAASLKTLALNCAVLTTTDKILTAWKHSGEMTATPEN